MHYYVQKSVTFFPLESVERFELLNQARIKCSRMAIKYKQLHVLAVCHCVRLHFSQSAMKIHRHLHSAMTGITAH